LRIFDRLYQGDVRRGGLVRSALIALALAASGCGDTAGENKCGARATCTSKPGEAPDGGLPGYVFCTNPEATWAWFQATDGKQYFCVSASDCALAFQQVTDWCRKP
jgi:hypothetical protein